MSSSLTITNTDLDAVTPDGLLQLWSNAFGVGDVYPDTAALILKPTSLLSAGSLGGYKLVDLSLDEPSYQDVSGGFQVNMPAGTGTPLATWSVALTPSANTKPVGLALFNKTAGLLFFVSAYAQWPANIPGPYTWVGKVPLGTCPASS